MEPLSAQQAAAAPVSFTVYDHLFLVFIALVFCVVTWLGVFTRQEALKTEATKSNGEAWANWFKEASTKRFEAHYDVAACAGGEPANTPNAAPAGPAAAALPDKKAVAATAAATVAATATATATATAAAPSPAAGSWGACLAQLLLDSSFKDMRNPFTGQAPRHIGTCVSSDISLAGAIDIDKSVATPAGSAMPFVKSNLVSTDSIKEKLHLSITVCDKGGYPIKITDVEF
jgi:hypothetical protein